MNWTKPDQAEMEKDKHSKALAFASEAIKKLSFDNYDEDKRKVKEKTKEEMAMNLWSEEDKNDKETHTMLLDEEATKSIRGLPLSARQECTTSFKRCPV